MTLWAWVSILILAASTASAQSFIVQNNIGETLAEFSDTGDVFFGSDDMSLSCYDAEHTGITLDAALHEFTVLDDGGAVVFLVRQNLAGMVEVQLAGNIFDNQAPPLTAPMEPVFAILDDLGATVAFVDRSGNLNALGTVYMDGMPFHNGIECDLQPEGGFTCDEANDVTITVQNPDPIATPSVPVRIGIGNATPVQRVNNTVTVEKGTIVTVEIDPDLALDRTMAYWNLVLSPQPNWGYSPATQHPLLANHISQYDTIRFPATVNTTIKPTVYFSNITRVWFPSGSPIEAVVTPFSPLVTGDVTFDFVDGHVDVEGPSHSIFSIRPDDLEPPYDDPSTTAMNKYTRNSHRVNFEPDVQIMLNTNLGQAGEGIITNVYMKTPSNPPLTDTDEYDLSIEDGTGGTTGVADGGYIVYSQDEESTQMIGPMTFVYNSYDAKSPRFKTTLHRLFEPRPKTNFSFSHWDLGGTTETSWNTYVHRDDTDDDVTAHFVPDIRVDVASQGPGFVAVDRSRFGDQSAVSNGVVRYAYADRNGPAHSGPVEVTFRARLCENADIVRWEEYRIIGGRLVLFDSFDVPDPVFPYTAKELTREFFMDEHKVVVCVFESTL
jgi:hypothetical protein